MLRFTLAAAAATLAFSTLAEAKITITCLTNAGHLTRQHEPLMAEFNAMQDEIVVEYAAPAKNYGDTHLKMFRGSATNTLPDCAFQAYNQLPSLARALAERGQIVDMTPLMEAEGEGWTEANYSDAMLDLGRVDGAQYGMPFNASVIQWYYNADLFRQAGLDPDNFPTDWDGLFDAAQKIDALGDDILPMFMWLINGDDWGFQTLILQQGGRMMSPDGQTVAFDENDHALEAMKMAKRLHDEGGLRTDLDRETQFAAFTEGRMGLWGLSPAGARNMQERVGAQFDLRSHPFTVWNDAEGKLPTGGNAAMITTQDPEKIAAAWEYIKFVTGPRGQQATAEITGYLPTNRKVLGTDYMGDFYAANPYYATPVKQYDRAGPWSGYPGTQSEKIWREQASTIRAVMEGELTPEEGAAQLKDIAVDLMKR
ncbi:ABC transporter substrate-binding protein [uncultured Tateyamaria sp.]|uniref:ABC transporter substrate-binding protein n=1 Tax=uncultured Tateyamaria sp. TaxID=455651 RepID=UPI00262BF918|nr:ABC transporter substrate-binding protein [uncultured Tateyamaria sp.]